MALEDYAGRLVSAKGNVEKDKVAINSLVVAFMVFFFHERLNNVRDGKGSGYWAVRLYQRPQLQFALDVSSDVSPKW